MKPSAQQLIDKLGARPILVWGARMTGMGFLRFARKHGLPVVGFVDSDPSLRGRTVNGVVVHAPDDIPRLKSDHSDLVIVVAVALKEDEIVRSLAAAGCAQTDWVTFTDYVENYYTIDIVGTCNLRCLSCAHAMDYDNPKGVMPLEDFEKILAKMLKETGIVSHVSLYSWGEPLLHPDLEAIVSRLHEAGVAVAVSTNLSFTNMRFVEKVVRAEPDYLKISVSGFWPEAYDSTHNGGDIELVKANMIKLRELLDAHSVSTSVDVNYHLYRNNNGRNLEAMREFCKSLGFALSTTYALVMPLERAIAHCEGKPDAKLRELKDLLLVDIDEGREATKAFRDVPCRFLSNQVNIDWDRSVQLCCVCFKKPDSVIAADFLETSQDDLNARKTAHPLCAKCAGYGLPAYNLGFNQQEWRRIADQKQSTDQ